jgi:PilZ domain
MEQYNTQTEVSPELDTRKHPRFRARSVVRVHWNESPDRKQDGARNCSGVCTSIAVGGIGVYMVSEFAVGDRLGVEFLDQPSSIMQAEIVYRNGYDYGLKFLDVV